MLNSDNIAYVNVRPTVTTSTSASRCGAGTVTITATPSSGATIDWYSTSTGGSPLQSGSNTYTPSVDNSSTYYAQARNTTTGCVSASYTPVAVTVNAKPTISAQPTAKSVCSGTNATLSVAANAGSGSISKYEWFRGTTATGTNSNSLTTGTEGNYYVKVTNSNGCSVNSNTVVVTVNNNPSISAQPTAPHSRNVLGRRCHYQ